ncbi:PAS fold domain-containing protein [Sarocladium implicatum]|nr:PAS fold domain-containing protein [Sarocladium implicatum]
MSRYGHGQQPPPHAQGTPHDDFAQLDFDLGNVHDMNMDGQDGNDLMAFLDSNMIGGSFDKPMNLDGTDDATTISGNDFDPNSSTAATQGAVARSEHLFNTASNNVPGAGPLPPSAFGQLGQMSAGSTLTEFTKRRNWPAKVVEELKDFLQILDANGRIKYASPSILNVSGHSTEEIQDVFLKDLIHPDDQGVFVAELNESIASGNPLRMFYRFKKKDGAYTIFETIGHAHIAAAKFAPNPSNQSPFCQAVFMMARPYPTKNAGLLDSFLEHKIENERLKRRIAELRREEEADADEAQKAWTMSQEARSDMTPSEDTGASSAATPLFLRQNSSNDRHMTQSDREALNIALTRENLEGASAGSKPDSLRDKMARYEGSSHTDTIEMLTGLRYIEGERSKGITTGNASPTLIKGDAGIAIPVDRDPRTGEKKKRLKTSEEYLFSAGKDFLQDQGKDDDKKQGSQDNKSQGGAGGLLSSFGVDSSFLDSATSEASKRAGSSGSSDMFSNIVSAIGGKEDKLAKEDLDEEDAVKQHKKEYKGEKGDEQADVKSLGTAAAVQALKLWNQGEAGNKQDKGSFLGLAMSEASKLFDDKAAKGDVKSGTDKQSVIQQAGEVAMKLFLKGQGQQQGGLAGLASKFL